MLSAVVLVPPMASPHSATAAVPTAEALPTFVRALSALARSMVCVLETIRTIRYASLVLECPSFHRFCPSVRRFWDPPVQE